MQRREKKEEREREEGSEIERKKKEIAQKIEEENQKLEKGFQNNLSRTLEKWHENTAISLECSQNLLVPSFSCFLAQL